MATQLLNDDGTASMATMIMSSHHAFRRDIAAFARALSAFDPSRAEALSEAWTSFRGALHAHHTVEDTSMFPDMRAQHPELGAAIDELDGQHRAIDPLLERGDEAFAKLTEHTDGAREVVAAIAGLLATHLDAEEAAIIPHLRGAKQFPPLPDESAVAAYAQGFAWSMAGLSRTVCEQICAMLPPALVAQLPAASEAFDARCRSLWGYAHTGSSDTSVPG